MTFPGKTETEIERAVRRNTEDAERLLRQCQGTAEKMLRRVHDLSVADAQAVFDLLGEDAGAAVEEHRALVAYINQVRQRNGMDPWEPDVAMHDLTVNEDGTVTVSEGENG